MSFDAICKKTCTIPKGIADISGYVVAGVKVVFDIDEWDLKEIPCLKYFKAAARGTTKKVGPTESSKKENTGDGSAAGGDNKEDPIVVALGKRVISMTPDELDSVGPKQIGEAYGISWQGRSKADVVSDAIKKDKGE